MTSTNYNVLQVHQLTELSEQQTSHSIVMMLQLQIRQMQLPAIQVLQLLLQNRLFDVSMLNIQTMTVLIRQSYVLGLQVNLYNSETELHYF